MLVEKLCANKTHKSNKTSQILVDDDGSNQLQIAITIAENGMKNKLEPLMVELGQTVCRTCIAMKLNPDRYTDDTRITK